MTFEKINIDDLTAEQWQEYFVLLESLKTGRAEENVKDAAELREVREKYKKDNPAFFEYVILKKGEMYGWFRFVAMDKQRPRSVFVLLRTKKDRMSESLRIFVLNLLYESLTSYGLDKVSFHTKQDLVKELAVTSGFKKINTINYFELRREDVNKEKIEEWIRDLKPEGLRLEFYDSVPAKYLEQYCSLFTELLNQMPSDDPDEQPFVRTPEDHKAWESKMVDAGGRIYMYFLFNEKDELVGKTNLQIRTKQNRYHQFMTGVRHDYRGRSLGKWMKANMYKKLFEDFPDAPVIDADTFEANKYMENINTELGFKKVGSGSFYELTLTGLEQMLKDNINQKELI